MMIVRYADAAGTVRVGVEQAGRVTPVPGVTTLAELLRQPVAAIRSTVAGTGDRARSTALSDVRLLAPIDGHSEVWAAGVTYRRSREARVEESAQAADVYQRVYDADRPELFFKSAAWRVTGDRGQISVRRDSPVNVPEPELALVLNSAAELVGYTICNDVSSRSIEGENPLYLPQAKVYLGGCAVGPGIRPAWEVDDPLSLGIEMTIERAGSVVWAGRANTAELHRRFEDLVAYLFREEVFPDGVVLSTGTSLVPELPTTLLAGDRVSICIDEIGVLNSEVRHGKDKLGRLASPTDRSAPEHVRPGDASAAVWSVDPRTGARVEMVGTESAQADVDATCALASAATGDLEQLGREGRARVLRSMAAALERSGDRIVGLADRETALGQQRLVGELTRTCYQLRLFADVLDEGSYLEAAIDHAGDTPMGPRPDLRRMLVPVGPVAVFGASNFPLAFSVPGGDTASAVAAGCPVVVKAHPSHPATSALCGDLLTQGAREAGAPEGTIGLVHGVGAGAALVAHPAIRAVGFTGSLAGGQTLMRIIETRPEPIPFYGELSSLNPVVVTPQAARERTTEIAAGLVGSFTMGAGQFCTKPGLVLVPATPAGDQLVAAMAAQVASLDSPHLLNDGIARSYRERTALLRSLRGAHVLAEGQPGHDPGFTATPMLVGSSATDLPDLAVEECFGPVTVVVRWSTEAELHEAIQRTPPSLTATVLRGAGEVDLPGRLGCLLRGRAGRLLFDAFPTGVAVSWAQHHGGPWPSTSSQHTSVGTTAIRRFLRPVTWQNAPEELLPDELRDHASGVPRRVDGAQVAASGGAPVSAG